MNRGAPQALRNAAAAMVELFKWWRAEMNGLGQALLRLLPSRRSPQLILRIGYDSASLERRVQKTWTTIGTVLANADGTWPAELPGLAPELRDARTAIVLPPRELYFEDIELPLAAARHLGAVLRLQLERRLPVSLELLAIDHQIVARDKQRELMRVRCAVAHRDCVESWCERAKGWGLNAVSVGSANTAEEPEYNLLKRRRDPLRWSLSPLDRTLLRFAAGGAVVCLALVGAQWARERSQVRAETAELHARAEKLQAQRVVLTTRAAPLVALRSIAATPAAPELLAKLSASVPGTAWFNHVDLTTPWDSTGSVKLIGTVASQDETVAVLRTIPGVSNLRTQTVFSGNFLGRDRVEITADYRPGGAGP